jgi:hypothetical protein
LGLGQNPSSDLVVTYYFADKPAKAKLEFLDNDGSVIKATTKIPVQAGINHFEWDLRYPDAKGIDGENHLAGGSVRGPIAIPGAYRVKLTTDSASYEQSFAILADPRLQTTNDKIIKM